MNKPIDVELFFNFRSPYCYLASKTMFALVDEGNANIVWLPLGGWDGRSPPDRAKVKMPLVHQDVKRFVKRMNIPFTLPPVETDSTAAGAASLYAEQQGMLREFIVATMAKEWGEGKDIGKPDVLREIAGDIGLDADALVAASQSADNLAQLTRNSELAAEKGVIGVPTFVMGDEIFWGQDRLNFVMDHLLELQQNR